MPADRRLRTGGHTFYDLHVDLIFITKYRRGVITDRVRSALEAPYTPKTSISNLVNSLKGVSSRRVRAVGYPEVRRALWGSAFWSPSYCAVSCGGAPLETIKRYIQSQRLSP